MFLTSTSGDALLRRYVAPASLQFSQRNILNVNFLSTFDYAFINHFQQADNWLTPEGGYTSAPLWASLIDANGFPNSASATSSFGGGPRIPDPANFAGPYIFTYKGNGACDVGSGTWTEANLNTTAATITGSTASIAGTNAFFAGQPIKFGTTVGNIVAGTQYYISATGLSGSAFQISATSGGSVITPSTSGSATVTPKGQGTYTKSNNGQWVGVSGQVAYIAVTLSTSGLSGPQLLNVHCTVGSDAFVNTLAWYRFADETDYLAGLIFRRPWKQPIVNLDPSAIRTMNWIGENSDFNYRWENRNLPSYAGFSQSSNYQASPVYAAPTTGTNQYALAAAVPTTSNVKTTPATPIHGEVVTAVLSNAAVRDNGNVQITAISNASPGIVTTATAHGYNTGDQIIQIMPNGVMPTLNYFPVTITVIDSTHYSIGVNTTSLGTFSGTGSANQFITLQVGSQSPYPVVWATGAVPINYFGNFLNNAGSVNTFYFDKTIAGKTDGAGNFVLGAWICNAGAANSGPHNGDVPLEIATALVNELNAMGPTHPINLYLVTPPMAMMTGDPDYSAGSNWAVNAVNTVLNGANGYAGLTSQAGLFLEYGNETWNSGDTQANYLAWRGYQRWSASGTGDYVDMAMLRAIISVQDVKAAFPGNNRIKFVAGGFLGGGDTTGSFNGLRMLGAVSGGGSYYLNDPLNLASANAITVHDAFAINPYINPPDSYYSGGSFASDSALYAMGGSSATTALSNFLAQNFNSGGSPNVNDLTGATTVIQGIVGLLPSGKTVISYEGGPNWVVATGQSEGGHTMTTADTTFVTAFQLGSQWATAETNFFNGTGAKTANPAIYLEIGGYVSPNSDLRWSNAVPDNYSGGIEGNNVLNSAVWNALATRNTGISP